MALGGGTFIAQNKILPGAYINFISTAYAGTQLSDRGYVAIALELDWGTEHEIMTVENAAFQKNTLSLFGYHYTDEKLKGLRDLFMNATTAYIYRLTSGGEKASNTYATARYCGTRGNALKVVIQTNPDNASLYNVSLYFDTQKVDEQKGVQTATDLLDNEYVIWKKDAALAVTAGENLSNGTNGEVNGTAHQTFLDLAESYQYNILACTSTDDIIKGLYVAYTKRMRDEVGAKFQLVVHRKSADEVGVINVTTDTTDTTAPISSAVYWVAGANAGCPVNQSLLNKKYDGEFTLNTKGTQIELEKAIQNGEFRFHKVGNEARVLSDINSFVTTTDTKGEVFQSNQTIRVCDQVANDVAVLFNTKYLGVVPNDKPGRISLQANIISLVRQLQEIRAVENFTEEDVVVEQGETKKAVAVSLNINIVNAMGQLYMNVMVN